MGWLTGALVSGGASLLGSVLTSGATKNAADTQTQAAQGASQVAQKQFDTTQQNLQPYQGAGTVALNALETGLGLPQTAPAITQQNFNAQAYLAANPDVAADPYYGQNPYQHYLQHGQYEVAQGRPLGFAPPTASTSTNVPQGSLTKPFTLADFNASPAYQFNLSQGQQAIDKAAAARGAFYSCTRPARASWASKS